MNPNSIDVLMSLDPLELSKQDLDAIIAYERKSKANFDAGIKPKKGDGVQVDFASIVANLAGTAPKGKVDDRRD